jgi:hypothetical protein
VPANFAAFPGAQAAYQAGEKLWLSIWLDPTPLAAGVYDSQLAAFAATLPAGTRLTLMHEPSTAAHHLSISAYVTAFDHGSAVIQAANPLVLTGPIDVRSNVIRYHFMDTLDRRYVQFVGMDAYDGVFGGPATNSLQTVAGAALAYVQKEFPGVPVGFAEFNSSRTVGRAQWVADALAWGKSAGADPMLLFTSAAVYKLTDQEQRDLAALITAPAVSPTTPVISVTQPVGSSPVSGNLTVAGTATAAAGISSVTVTVDGGSAQLAIGTTDWSASIDTTQLADGPHTITINAVDRTGNTGTSSVAVTVNNSPVTPAASITIAQPANNSTVSGAVTVSGTATATPDPASVQIAVDGGTPQPAAGTTTWTASVSTTGLTNGPHTIAAQALDSSGQALAATTTTVTVANPVATACPTPPAGATELSGNLSLETNQTGWTVPYNTSTQLSRVTPAGGSYDGKAALQIAPKAGKSGIAGVKNQSPNWVPGPPGLSSAAGTSYTGTAVVRASTPGESVTLVVRETTASGTVLGTHTTVTTLGDTSWHQITSSDTAKTTGNLITYVLYATNLASSSQFFLADCLGLQRHP